MADHFYTASAPERDNAIQQGWYIDEGIACYVLTEARRQRIPLFRLYNGGNGDHFYTTSAPERDIAVQQHGYTAEGIACYVFAGPGAHRTALYRLYNGGNGDHFYTTSAPERDNAVQQHGYAAEGIACYVFKGPRPLSVPLFRLLQKVAVPPAETDGKFVILPETLEFAGVHAALLTTGKVLYFSYYPPEEDNANKSKWQLWEQGLGTSPGFDHNRNLFCAGHCFLPDGRLLTAAGQSNNVWPMIGWGADHDLHTFDPASQSWTRHQDMPAARYYPTCQTLADGRALIVGGAASRYFPITVAPASNVVNDEFELFDWRDNSKTPPKSFNPGHISELYPLLSLLPDGSPHGVLFVHSKDEARLYYPGPDIWNPKSFKTASAYSRTYPHQGSHVLLPLRPEEPGPVRVMVVGGEGADGHATETAEIFELNSQDHKNSAFRPPAGGNMSHRRFMADSVLLADGMVLVVNGAGGGSADHSHDPVLEAELFDPRTETWRPIASINRPRMYHSSAILLPSGQVLIAGNTEHWNPENEVEDTTLELFDPPYLARGPRPVINAAPARVTYGQEFAIGTPHAASIIEIAFIRATSVTHSNNMDQRYVGLQIVGRGAAQLTVRAPADGTYAPPGHYLLFIVDDQRVPSVARIVSVDPPVAGPASTSRWSDLQGGRLRTSDGDDIDFSIQRGAVSTDIVEFVLTLGQGVTWKKVLNMPDGQGSSWDIVAEGAGASSANSLWAGQVHNGQSLTFKKAKFLGVMTDVHVLGELGGLTPGARVLFTWAKD